MIYSACSWMRWVEMEIYKQDPLPDSPFLASLKMRDGARLTLTNEITQKRVAGLLKTKSA